MPSDLDNSRDGCHDRDLDQYCDRVVYVEDDQQLLAGRTRSRVTHNAQERDKRNIRRLADRSKERYPDRRPRVGPE